MVWWTERDEQVGDDRPAGRPISSRKGDRRGMKKSKLSRDRKRQGWTRMNIARVGRVVPGSTQRCHGDLQSAGRTTPRARPIHLSSALALPTTQRPTTLTRRPTVNPPPPSLLRVWSRQERYVTFADMQMNREGLLTRWWSNRRPISRVEQRLSSFGMNGVLWRSQQKGMRDKERNGERWIQAPCNCECTIAGSSREITWKLALRWTAFGRINIDYQVDFA